MKSQRREGMRTVSLLLSMTAVLVLSGMAGCSSANEGQNDHDSDTTGVTDGVNDTGTNRPTVVGDTKGSDAFAAAAEQWQSANISSYRFTFNWSCFCLRDYVRPVEITVKDRAITAVRYADDKTEVPKEKWGDYMTIDGLFDYLAEAYARPADSIRESYDATYGYPTDIYIDFEKMAADEEKGFGITGFEVM